MGARFLGIVCCYFFGGGERGAGVRTGEGLKQLHFVTWKGLVQWEGILTITAYGSDRPEQGTRHSATEFQTKRMWRAGSQVRAPQSLLCAHFLSVQPFVEPGFTVPLLRVSPAWYIQQGSSSEETSMPLTSWMLTS